MDAQTAAGMWANLLGQKPAAPVGTTAAATAVTATAAATAVTAFAAATTTAAPVVNSIAAASATTVAAGGSDLNDLQTQFAAEALKHDPTSDEAKQYSSIAAMIAKANVALATTQAPAAAAPLTAAPAVAVVAGAVAGATTPDPEGSQYAPTESMSDGNKCPDDEEEYPATTGTCFKTCSDLTGGVYPIRTSPFSCCKAQPCSFSNTKSHFGFCGGFDVSGDSEHGGCPTTEGACLTDEELFDGICYKKCSSFDSVHAHRVAPNMCCSTQGLACLLPSNFKFSADYATGGGQGDGLSSTPNQPHAPLTGLTEGGSTTLPR